MRFLLDTCVVSDFAQGRPEVLARIKASAPDDLAASVVTEMEVAYGLLLNPRLAARLKPIMDDFFGAIRVLPYDAQGGGGHSQGSRQPQTARAAHRRLRRFNCGNGACKRADPCYLQSARV